MITCIYFKSAHMLFIAFTWLMNIPSHISPCYLNTYNSPNLPGLLPKSSQGSLGLKVLLSLFFPVKYGLRHLSQLGNTPSHNSCACCGRQSLFVCVFDPDVPTTHRVHLRDESAQTVCTRCNRVKKKRCLFISCLLTSLFVCVFVPDVPATRRVELRDESAQMMCTRCNGVKKKTVCLFLVC